MKLIDEMLHLDLLTPEQHRHIDAWLRTAKTPEAVLAMPAHLWDAVASASTAMNVDADFLRPPMLGADIG